MRNGISVLINHCSHSNSSDLFCNVSERSRCFVTKISKRGKENLPVAKQAVFIGHINNKKRETGNEL